MERKVNVLMTLLSLIGGLIGFAAGELMIAKFQYYLPNSVLTGLYFGVLSLCIGIMCIIAEMISPKLNGMNWRRMYVPYSWKFLVPCTLLILFISGAVLQFIYGLNFNGAKKINDVVMLIDTSGSMNNTDPQNKRFEAVRNLLDHMDVNNRAAVFIFNDKTINIQQMDNVTDGLKTNVINELSAHNVPSGETNIEGALNDALSNIKSSSQPDRAAMVMLLSDGGDSYDLKKNINQFLSTYKKADIPIFTVGMQGSDYNLLRKLSGSTGGKYYSVNNVNDLNKTFNRIYMERDMRLLMGERNGSKANDMIYGILRVLFITIIGVLLGLSIGLIFDNRYIAKSLIIGGAVSGIAAGLILETGFMVLQPFDYIVRLSADAVLSSIFTLFAANMPQSERSNIYGINIKDKDKKGTDGPGRKQGNRSF